MSSETRNRLIMRHWELVRLLRHAHGITLRELSERLGVHQRTVRRDIEALEELHMPIVRDSDGLGESDFEGVRFSWMSTSGCPACGRRAA